MNPRPFITGRIASIKMTALPKLNNLCTMNPNHSKPKTQSGPGASNFYAVAKQPHLDPHQLHTHTKNTKTYNIVSHSNESVSSLYH